MNASDEAAKEYAERWGEAVAGSLAIRPGALGVDIVRGALEAAFDAGRTFAAKRAVDVVLGAVASEEAAASDRTLPLPCVFESVRRYQQGVGWVTRCRRHRGGFAPIHEDECTRSKELEKERAVLAVFADGDEVPLSTLAAGGFPFDVEKVLDRLTVAGRLAHWAARGFLEGQAMTTRAFLLQTARLAVGAARQAFERAETLAAFAATYDVQSQRAAWTRRAEREFFLALDHLEQASKFSAMARSRWA